MPLYWCVVSHTWTEHQNTVWKDAEIIAREENWFKEKCNEAVLIENRSAHSNFGIGYQSYRNTCYERSFKV